MPVSLFYMVLTHPVIDVDPSVFLKKKIEKLLEARGCKEGDDAQYPVCQKKKRHLQEEL